ncbi:hypothetical protein KTR10_02715 [Candidatus Kaiserbacteria bacterium]|nr:hypothetical protein [Candidatus Kaiserbacteria bacterium]
MSPRHVYLTDEYSFRKLCTFLKEDVRRISEIALDSPERYDARYRTFRIRVARLCGLKIRARKHRLHRFWCANAKTKAELEALLAEIMKEYGYETANQAKTDSPLYRTAYEKLTAITQ